MLIHTVLLQPKRETTQEEIDQALARIQDLQRHIPEILEVKVARNLNGHQLYTYGFIMHFASEEQLKRYAEHPTHTSAGAELRRICTSIIDFDMLS